jgi:hypothetical protein
MHQVSKVGQIVLAVLVLHFASSNLAHAQAPPSQTVVCTTTPIIFGTAASFGLQGNTGGLSTTSAIWEFQWTVNGGTTAWTAFDVSQGLKLTFPGTLAVRCRLSYSIEQNGGQTATAQPSTSVDVPPPDGVKIVGSLAESVGA